MKKSILIIQLILLVYLASAQTSPIKNVTGRIAYTADGDEHDTDDWLASPWSIALLRASGQDSKVVHFEYNNHVWSSTSGFAAIQNENVTGAFSLWGGFVNVKIFNVEKQEAAAKTNLVNVINASSATDPLWLIAAGPIETIGRAVDAAQASKLQYVTVISHSDWNNVHANEEHNSKYTISYLTGKGVKYKKVNDMNGDDTNGTLTSKGLKRKVSIMENVLKNHTDQRVKWLWTCRQMPEYEKPSFQKGKYDYSDAGMTWWLITGGMASGDEGVTPKKTLDLLEAYIKSTPTSIENENSLESTSDVFPNPSLNGKFYLSKSSNWEVFSHQGLKIVDGNGTEIDLSAFNKGVYFLKPENGTTQKILLQ
jgi:Secretion system C-terminal sorting domain